MHAQVPQYIDVEDKIIGPLTLKQFLYFLISAGILFLLFKILKFSLFIIIAIPIGIFTFLLAFYKIGNQNFSKFIVGFLRFITKPNVYIWKKLPPKIAEKEPMPKIIKKAEPIKRIIPEGSKLEELRQEIDIQQ